MNKDIRRRLKQSGLAQNIYIKQVLYIIFVKVLQEAKERSLIPATSPPFTTLKEMTYAADPCAELNDLFHVMRSAYTKKGDGDHHDELRSLFSLLFKGARCTLPNDLIIAIIWFIDRVIFFSESFSFAYIVMDLISSCADNCKRLSYEVTESSAFLNMIIKCLDLQPHTIVYNPCANMGDVLITALSQVNNPFFVSYFDESRDMQRRITYLNLFVNGYYKKDRRQVRDITHDKGEPVPYVDCIIAKVPTGWSHKKNSNDIIFKEIAYIDSIIDSMNSQAQAALIVPDRLLYEDGPYKRIRKRLLRDCNLHSVFIGFEGKPGYIGRPTVIFFKRNGPTKETLLYHNPFEKAVDKNIDETYDLIDFTNFYNMNRTALAEKQRGYGPAVIKQREDIEKEEKLMLLPCFKRKNTILNFFSALYDRLYDIAKIFF